MRVFHTCVDIKKKAEIRQIDVAIHLPCRVGAVEGIVTHIPSVDRHLKSLHLPCGINLILIQPEGLILAADRRIGSAGLDGPLVICDLNRKGAGRTGERAGQIPQGKETIVGILIVDRLDGFRFAA